MKLNNIGYLLFAIIGIGAVGLLILSFFGSIVKSGLVHDGFFWLLIILFLGWFAFWVCVIRWALHKWKSKYASLLIVVGGGICIIALLFVANVLHYPSALLGIIFVILFFSLGVYSLLKIYFKGIRR